MRAEGCWCIYTNGAATEIEGGPARLVIVVDVGEGLFHLSSKLGDGGRSGSGCELVIRIAEEVQMRILVIVDIVGGNDAVAMLGP